MGRAHRMMDLVEKNPSGDGWEQKGADNWMKYIELTNE